MRARAAPAEREGTRNVMEDAGFILGSYVAHRSSTVAFFAWRTLRSGRNLAEQIPDEDKYWL